MEEEVKLIPNAVSNRLGRSLLHLQKASPQVMFGVGVVGVVGATVLACRATMRVSDALDPVEKQRDRSEQLHLEHQVLLERDGIGTDYDDKAYAKDQVALRIKMILTVTKLYAPAAGLMMLSVGLLTGSHVTLNKRNASLTAAYATVDQAFEKYRARVKDQLGEEQDRDFRYGTRNVEETVEGKDGKSKVIAHKRVSTESPSLYAKFFDQLCKDWQNNPEYNRIFLQAQQGYFNQLLQSRGHVFLNEVYQALGIEHTSAGAVVGWVLGGPGDDYIDFGIFDDITNPRVRDFVNGDEASILLDFNVNGVIYNLLDKSADHLTV
jgi:hypothetical protein